MPATPLRTLSRSAWRDFAGWFNALELSEDAILLGFALAIGVGAALGAVGFYRSIDLAYAAFYRIPESYLSRIGIAAYRPVVTAVGLAVAWWVMRYIGRGHDGLNVPDVQLAVVRRGGDIPTRPALARTLASAVTIGCGGSAGSEGPVVVLGATVGSFLGRAFLFSPERVRILVAAGAGAAISAAFNAPIAGAFFALEEIVGSLAVGAFPPIVVASVIAAVVSRAFLGNHPAFPLPVEYGYGALREVLVYFPVLGVAIGLLAVAFVRVYFGCEWLARRYDRYRRYMPWIGGLVVGAMVVLSGGLLVGYGHLAVRLEVFGHMQWWALALLAFGSILATSVTLNSGGSGGLFTPSLYVGAAAGGAVGVALAHLDHGVIRPEIYAIVGMGAMVAAATHAPITGILLVFEMTNDYAVVLPLMLATVVAYIVAHHFERDSLYSGWLRRRGENIESGADRALLAGIRVAEVYDPQARVVLEHEDVAQLVEHLGHGDQTTFPVVAVDGVLVGAITVGQLGSLAKNFRDLGSIVLAADIAQPAETVTPAATLLDATRRMGVRGSSAISVVSAETGQLLGLLTRAHILGAYERAVAGTGEHRSGAEALEGATVEMRAR